MREKAETRDKKQLLLRLSPDLWEKINQWSEEEFRSVNGQIEYLLSEAVKKKYGKVRGDKDYEKKDSKQTL
jgi:hypothetical protein